MWTKYEPMTYFIFLYFIPPLISVFACLWNSSLLIFCVLLRVHLSIYFLLVINQLDVQKFCFIVSLFHASTCFDHHVLIIRRSKLYYTASGIITPIGCIIQFWPPDDKHMCSKHVEAWNKLTIKQNFCASSWLITKINILTTNLSRQPWVRYIGHP